MRIAQQLKKPLTGVRLDNFRWKPRLALSRDPAKLRENAVLQLAASSKGPAQGSTAAARTKSRRLFARGFESAVEAVRGGLIKGPRYRRLRVGDLRQQVLDGVLRGPGHDSTGGKEATTYIGTVSHFVKQLHQQGAHPEISDKKVRAQRILSDAGKMASNKGRTIGGFAHVSRINWPSKGPQSNVDSDTSHAFGGQYYPEDAQERDRRLRMQKIGGAAPGPIDEGGPPLQPEEYEVPEQPVEDEEPAQTYRRQAKRNPIGNQRRLGIGARRPKRRRMFH